MYSPNTHTNVLENRNVYSGLWPGALLFTWFNFNPNVDKRDDQLFRHSKQLYFTFSKYISNECIRTTENFRYLKIKSLFKNPTLMYSSLYKMWMTIRCRYKK